MRLDKLRAELLRASLSTVDARPGMVRELEKLYRSGRIFIDRRDVRLMWKVWGRGHAWVCQDGLVGLGYDSLFMMKKCTIMIEAKGERSDECDEIAYLISSIGWSDMILHF